MAVVLVTGSTGLVGAETIRSRVMAGYTVGGVDNNMEGPSWNPPNRPLPEDR